MPAAANLPAHNDDDVKATDAHTPGPWFADVGWSVIGDERVINIVPKSDDLIDNVLAEVPFDDDEPDANAWANARLIAAAPKLLRVAELLVSWLDEEEGAHALCNTARAAIRKAKGAL